MSLEKEEDKMQCKTINSFEGLEEFLSKKKDVLCIPEKRFHDYEGQVLNPDTFDFAKWFREKRPDVSIDVIKADGIADLRSGDYWLPLVLLAGDVSFQVYLGIVANYIYDKLRGSLNHDKASVHLKTIYRSAKDGKFKKFEYDGSVDGLTAIIKKVDLNEFMEE
jgi:hypothetical protein